MRRLLAVSFILLATVYGNAFQNPPQATVAVTIRSIGQKDAGGVGLQRDQFYVGAPWVTTPAAPFAPESNVTASGFRLRAWKEGNLARVVVYAVRIDDRSPKGETETLISTFGLRIGQSVEVKETEDWGAAHVVVTAIRHASKP